jgi:hypothetical protein
MREKLISYHSNHEIILAQMLEKLISYHSNHEIILSQVLEKLVSYHSNHDIILSQVLENLSLHQNNHDIIPSHMREKSFDNIFSLPILSERQTMSYISWRHQSLVLNNSWVLQTRLAWNFSILIGDWHVNFYFWVLTFSLYLDVYCCKRKLSCIQIWYLHTQICVFICMY